MSDGTISVIIPVFRTEKYLEKCIGSVMAQTYEKLEIILVDDGSDDKSGEICDSFAKKDSRIRVIHKDNGGLSSARNAGLEASGGDYIAFVDSDDYINSRMYEELMSALDGADISICGYYTVNSKGETNHSAYSEKTVLSKDEALRELFRDEKIKNHVWNKLFKKELFSSVSFPEGRIFEDILTTYKLFEKAEKIACIPYSGYYYCDRDGAISKNASYETCLARYNAHLDRFGDVKLRARDSKDVLLRQLYIQARAYLFSNPQSIEDTMAVRDFFTANEKCILSSKEFSPIERLQVQTIVNCDTALIKLVDILRKAEKLLRRRTERK